jgi:phospholipase/carboxylesterase
MQTREEVMRFGVPRERAQAVAVLLHGRGGSAQDMVRLGEAMGAEGYALLAPSAPLGSWYPQRFLAPLAQNEPALSEALAVVHRLVEAAGGAGISAERVGLLGFSQGACLALEYAARRPRRYAWVAGLSGALVGPLAAEREVGPLAGTPVLLGCAEADAHIPLEYVEASAAGLARAGADVTRQIFPGAAHTVFPEELAWLRARVSARG